MIEINKLKAWAVSYDTATKTVVMLEKKPNLSLLN